MRDGGRSRPFPNGEEWELAREYVLDQLPGFLETWSGNPARLVAA
jgi:hypothetical protein